MGTENLCYAWYDEPAMMHEIMEFIADFTIETARPMLEEVIDAHLREFVPLIEEGGFIPTVDHLVPPDVSWANFEHYIRRKRQLLRGESF